VSQAYERLDFGPGWQTTNENLIELVDLFQGETLDWTPRAEEWSARTIFAHIIAARYHGPIATANDVARAHDMLRRCSTAEGIKEELRASWAAVASFLSDRTKLDAIYQDRPEDREQRRAGPPVMGSVERSMAGFDLGYVDAPDQYTGHYIAYHRFAHDLHHRSTLIGYLVQLGVSLDGHRIRPL
jgi:hypothetical protein